MVKSKEKRIFIIAALFVWQAVLAGSGSQEPFESAGPALYPPKWLDGAEASKDTVSSSLNPVSQLPAFNEQAEAKAVGTGRKAIVGTMDITCSNQRSEVCNRHIGHHSRIDYHRSPRLYSTYLISVHRSAHGLQTDQRRDVDGPSQRLSAPP